MQSRDRLLRKKNGYRQEIHHQSTLAGVGSVASACVLALYCPCAWLIRTVLQHCGKPASKSASVLWLTAGATPCTRGMVQWELYSRVVAGTGTCMLSTVLPHYPKPWPRAAHGVEVVVVRGRYGVPASSPRRSKCLRARWRLAPMAATWTRRH